MSNTGTDCKLKPMPNRTEHERLVREVASEMGASVTLAGSGHLRVSKGSWFVTLPCTPKRTFSKQAIRNRIDNHVMKMAVKKADRFGK